MSDTANMPSSWLAADTRLGKRESRKIANNTYLERDGDGSIGIRLHATTVVRFAHPESGDAVTLNTGGWYTVTTKQRINAGLPGGWAVWSDKGRWYLHRYADKARFPFTDGITLHPDTGEVDGHLSPDTVKADDDAATADRKLINNWLRRTTPEQIVHAFENAGGDCWLCAGIDPTDADHLREHVRESYVMLTLTRNAVRERGYFSPDTILSMIYHDAKRGVVSTDYTSNLRKYLIRHIVAATTNGRAYK